MELLLPCLLLLMLKMTLVPAASITFKPGRVLAGESEEGRIVSVQYWEKFRVFMDQLDAADFSSRTEMLTSPDTADSLVPPSLLTAVSARLNDSRWLDRLESEYITDGHHNMTVLMDTLQELGSIAEEHEETVPEGVLKQVLWRGLVRPEQQHIVRARLVAALELFFDTAEAVRLQRQEPELFEIFLLTVFEFDWMPVLDVLEDTLSDVHLNARLAEEVDQAEDDMGSIISDDPDSGPIVRVEYWEKFRNVMDKLNEADEKSKTAMMESPEIWEVLVPYELLFEVSDHLKNGAWLDQLEAEYLSGGSHNMTVAMDTLQELIRVAEQNELRVPDDAIRHLLWRGLVQFHQQQATRSRLDSALQLFFGTEEATSLQDREPQLFGLFVVDVFEFIETPVEKILKDTMANLRRRVRIADKVFKGDSENPRAAREEPFEGPHLEDQEEYSPEAWKQAAKTFPVERSLGAEAETLDDGEMVHRRSMFGSESEASPSWEYDVDEDDVEVVDEDSGEEGARHGGGLVWPEGPVEDEINNSDMFEKASSYGAAWKEAREAHHGDHYEERPDRHYRADVDRNVAESHKEQENMMSESWEEEEPDDESLVHYVEDSIKKERALGEGFGRSSAGEGNIPHSEPEHHDHVLHVHTQDHSGQAGRSNEKRLHK